MSTKNAFAALRRDWGFIKEHVADDLTYVRNARQLMLEERDDILSDIRKLQDELRQSQRDGRELVQSEFSVLRGTVKTYIKRHGGALVKGLWADIKRLAREAVRYGYQVPVALVAIALWHLAAGVAFLAGGKNAARIVLK